MIHKILTFIMGFLFLVACSTPFQNPRKIREGQYKSKALKIKQRSPQDDASTFYHMGGIGYIMTYGGVRFPIGIKCESEQEMLDFERLQPFSPLLYSQIKTLIDDPGGTLTLEHVFGHVQLSNERRFYQDIRGAYASQFNRRMQLLAKHQKTRDCIHP